MYRRLQGKRFSTLQQGLDEVVVDFMVLYGLQLVSIVKTWMVIMTMIGAST